MSPAPVESSDQFFKESMKWTHCPICIVKTFDSTARWNKYNRDSHVRACMKQKRLEQIESSSNETEFPQTQLSSTSSKLFQIIRIFIWKQPQTKNGLHLWLCQSKNYALI